MIKNDPFFCDFITDQIKILVKLLFIFIENLVKKMYFLFYFSYENLTLRTICILKV